MGEFGRLFNVQLIWALAPALVLAGVLKVLSVAHDMRLVFERAT